MEWEMIEFPQSLGEIEETALQAVKGKEIEFSD
jgi:hypothetical protein